MLDGTSSWIPVPPQLDAPDPIRPADATRQTRGPTQEMVEKALAALAPTVRATQAITAAVAFASTPHHLLLGSPAIYRPRKDLDDERRESGAWEASTGGADHPEAAVTTL